MICGYSLQLLRGMQRRGTCGKCCLSRIKDIPEKINPFVGVDVGIYHERWGIGSRVEDNCLLTETQSLNRGRPTRRE